MIESVYMPTRVIYGEGAVEEGGPMLAGLGKRCLIVTGGHSAEKSGALSDAIAVLKKQDIAYTVFNKIQANPLLSVCHQAGEQAREDKADFILGIGGGSVLDSAKAIAIYAADSTLSPEDIYKREYTGVPLKVALIGTTAGTGSEVTGVSVLTNDATGRKKSISGPDCYAALSLCDPSYTCSMPYAVTVSTALDAFCHAVEGYFTPKGHGMTALWAENGIPMLYEALKELQKTKALPDSQNREKLYRGSLIAGLVINTCGTAFPHPLGYVLTENFGIAHGAATAAFFPAFWERARRFSPQKAEKLCALCDTDEEAFAGVIAELADNRICLTADEAKAFAARWTQGVPKNFTASPGSLTCEEAENILFQLGK